MGVMITRGMFGKDDGQIQWYGIIATTNMSRESWAWRGRGDPGYCPAWDGRGGCRHWTGKMQCLRLA